MILPERNHAAQQIRASQDGAIGNGRSANHDMTAASRGIAVAAEIVFLRDQSILARLVVEQHVDLLEFLPILGRWHVNFEHARVGSDAERTQTRIGSRRIALYPDWHL